MHPLFTRSLPAGAVALLCAGQALAQQPTSSVTRLEPVAVVGSRVEQPLAASLGDVSVISRETIDRAGQSSLGDLLRREHGVEIVTNGGPQTVTSAFLRGANANHTLVLIDGMRVNSATTGTAAINAIALSDIERIEILRGTASSMYGSDAIGGVINVITRKGQRDTPPQVSGSVGYGNHATSRAEVAVNGGSGLWTYAVSAGHGRSNGFDATTPTNFSHNPDRDGYRWNNAAGALGLAWREGHQLALNVRQSRLNGQYDNGTDLNGNYFDDRSIQKLQGWSLSSTDRITSAWRSTLRIGRTVDDLETRNSPFSWGAPVDGISTLRTRQDQYSWQNDVDVAPGQRVTVAVERLVQRVDGTTQYDDDRRATNSVTAIYRGDFGPHHLQLNARNDRDSQYGNRATGGISYGYDITSAWRVTAGGSTGFRAPNFNELYWPNDGGFMGNPNLSPEKSRNLEVGLRYLGDSTEFSATAYRNRIENLIANGPSDPSDPWSAWAPYNVNQARLEGISLAFAQHWSNTTLRARGDLQRPRDRETGNLLPRRAKQQFNLTAEHRLGDLVLGAEWLVSGARYDDVANTVRLKGYSLFNLTASYDIDRHWQAQVRWNNVGNRDYTLAQGYRTPGSTVFVTLAYRPSVR